MATSVNIISTTSNNKTVSKSITNINPQVSNQNLKTAAQLFTAISDTTFKSADRIVKMNVDEEYAPPPTEEPILELGEFNYDGYRYKATVTYNGDGQLSANVDTVGGALCRYSNNEVTVQVTSGSSFSGTLYATAGTSYAAKSIEFSN